MSRLVLLCAIASALAPGCTGEFDAGPARPDSGVRDAAPPPPPCEGLCMGDTHVQRITAQEYQSSITSVLGIWPDVSNLPADGSVAGLFRSNEESTLLDDDVDRLRATAEIVAETYLRSNQTVDGATVRRFEQDLSVFPECETEDAACAAAFVADVGSRFFRRALNDEERATHADLYAWTVAPADADLSEGAGGTFEDAVRYSLELILQSPQFIYRPEAGTPVTGGRPGVVQLTSVEMGARLAAFLLRSVPDDELLRAGIAGELVEPAAIEAQARRLLEEHDDVWWTFAQDWLSTHQMEGSAVQTFAPDGAWTDRVPRELRFDVHLTFAHIARNDGHLRTLFTSHGGVVQGDESRWILPTTGDVWSWAPEIPGRHGILTIPGVLVATGHWGYTHAHQRGLLVRNRILCQDIGSPGPELREAVARAGREEESDPSALTDRARLERVTEGSPRCRSCHMLTNPIGYALDAYDAFGRSRTEEVGTDGASHPIDTRGTLAGRGDGSLATDVDGEFDGIEELAERLGESEVVARCVTRQFVRFALQREPDARDDHSIEAAYDRFDSTDRDLRELVVAITTTDAFRYRGLPPE